MTSLNRSDSRRHGSTRHHFPWGRGNFSRAVFRANWTGLFFGTLFYRFSSGVALYYLYQALVKFALKFTKYSYVTTQNLRKFILTPAGIAGVAVFAAAVLLAIYFEKMILLNGVQAGCAGVRMNLVQTLAGGFARGAVNLRHSLAFLTFPLLSYGFVADFPFFLELCYRINPYSTYLPKLLNQRPVKMGLAALLIILAVYSFFRIQSVWYRAGLGLSKRESRRAGKKLAVKSALIRIVDFAAAEIIAVLAWAAVRFAISAVVSVSCRLLAAPDLRTALSLTLRQYVSIITLFIAPVFAAFLHMKLLSAEFYSYTGADPSANLRTTQHLSAAGARRVSLALLTALVTAMVLPLYGMYTGAIQTERSAAASQIAAHRGFSSAAPENSLPAIELAIDFMADYVEIDVQCTSDGQVVLFHDTTVKRFTGKNTKVSDMTLAEIEQIDLGEGYGEEYAGTSVPTLGDALEYARGRIGLIIELKRNEVSDDLAEKVVGLVEKYGMENSCLFQSADYRYLYQLKTINPDLTCGMIVSLALGDAYTSNPNVDFFSVRSAFITGSVVSKIRKSGKQIYAWTVDTREEMERMKRLSVDMVITDYPILAREVMYRVDRDEFIRSVLDGMQADSAESETEAETAGWTEPAVSAAETEENQAAGMDTRPDFQIQDGDEEDTLPEELENETDGAGTDGNAAQ